MERKKMPGVSSTNAGAAGKNADPNASLMSGRDRRAARASTGSIAAAAAPDDFLIMSNFFPSSNCADNTGKRIVPIATGRSITMSAIVDARE